MECTHIYYYGVSDTMIFEYHYGALSLFPLCSGMGITLVLVLCGFVFHNEVLYISIRFVHVYTILAEHIQIY